MITPLSWRRADAAPIDPDETGSVGAAAQPLLATDAGSVTVLHLQAGGSTEVETVPVGQLVIVVAGDGVVQVGDEQVSVRTGDAVRWPSDVAHRLTTEGGVSVMVVTYPESIRSWRVSRVDDAGRRWVAGVFSDTERARAYRDRLRKHLAAGEEAVLE